MCKAQVGNLRIELKENEAYLLTKRYGTEFRILLWTGKRTGMPLQLAKESLLDEIRSYRRGIKYVSDKIANRRPGYFIRALEERGRELINSEKRPLSSARHVGVEIEFISSFSQGDIRKALIKAGLAKYVNLTTDGSVRGESNGEDCDGSCRENCECMYGNEYHHDTEAACLRFERHFGLGEEWEYREDCQDCEKEKDHACDCGGTYEVTGEATCEGHVRCVGHCPGHTYYDDYDCQCECDCTSGGHELRIIAPQKEIENVINKVCHVLSVECNAKVNDSCGLHVHLDMRRRDFGKAFNNLVKTQNLLYRLVPASRRRNQYCEVTPEADFTEALGIGRYHGINPESYRKHRTIEVRIHSGTVNAVKINNWIKLLIKIAVAAWIETPFTSLETLGAKIKLAPELREYLKTRLDKFSSEHNEEFTATQGGQFMRHIAA